MTAARHVLVTDASRGSALAFIRSLGERGWRVTAADVDRHSAGFRSRYVTGRLVYPSPADDAEAMVERIHEAVTVAGVDLVIPITDETGLPLAAARGRFDGAAMLALPDEGALAAAHDKAATLALAERLGVPVPPTRFVQDVASARSAAVELGYPVVLKPVVSRSVRSDGTVASFIVAYAGDEAELERRMATFEGATAVLLQRWLPGDGLGIEMLLDRGRPLAAFAHRRLREVPITGGASSLRESIPLDPDLYDHAARMLGELGWTGLAMVEFRRAPDGTAHLMEINGRVWGSLPLAVRSGMDFPGRLADLLLARASEDVAAAVPPLATDYRIGVRARNLRLDLGWIGSVLIGRRRYGYLPWPSRAAGVAALASLLDPRIADDHFIRSDPAPGYAQLASIVRDTIGRLRPRRG